MTFDEIEVSTKTFIVTTTCRLELEQLFARLPIAVCEHPERSKASRVWPADGSIVTVEFEHSRRGVDLKQRLHARQAARSETPRFFRNSLTVVMIMDRKNINFKLTRNGQFQMTGCKQCTTAARCVDSFFAVAAQNCDLRVPSPLAAIFIPAMRNIDFSVGFLIDRPLLDIYINTQTPHISLLETIFGYTGVNIKIEIQGSISDLMLKRMVHQDQQWKWSEPVPYGQYLETLPARERDKKLTKKRFNTFLVFQSGRVILSGIDRDFQRLAYTEFMRIITLGRRHFEEKLLEPAVEVDMESGMAL